jgi:anti-repressor protein
VDKLAQVFDYNGAQVRVAFLNGEPAFVANDVCAILEVDPTQTRRLDPDEKGLCSIQTPGGEQQMQVVTEAGLYALVLGSRKPEAREFKRWVTHEVLPQIRKHGLYAKDEVVDHILEDPDFGIALLTKYKEEKEQRKLLQAKVEADKPKVQFAETVSIADGNHTIEEAAKVFGIPGLGPINFFKFLRREKVLRSDKEGWNIPYQPHIEAGYFRVIEKTYNTNFGNEAQISQQTVVTGKGMQFLERLLRKHGYLPERAV